MSIQDVLIVKRDGMFHVYLDTTYLGTPLIPFRTKNWILRSEGQLSSRQEWVWKCERPGPFRTKFSAVVSKHTLCQDRNATERSNGAPGYTMNHVQSAWRTAQYISKSFQALEWTTYRLKSWNQTVRLAIISAKTWHTVHIQESITEWGVQMC